MCIVGLVEPTIYNDYQNVIIDRELHMCIYIHLNSHRTIIAFASMSQPKKVSKFTRAARRPPGWHCDDLISGAPNGDRWHVDNDASTGATLSRAVSGSVVPQNDCANGV